MYEKTYPSKRFNITLEFLKKHIKTKKGNDIVAAINQTISKGVERNPLKILYSIFITTIRRFRQTHPVCYFAINSVMRFFILIVFIPTFFDKIYVFVLVIVGIVIMFNPSHARNFIFLIRLPPYGISLIALDCHRCYQ